MKKESFSLLSFIKIRFADPISTIGLSKKNVAIGTMMGRVYLLSLLDKKISNLLDDSIQEHISGIIFDKTDNFFYTAVGDEEILKLDTKTDSNKIKFISKSNNYKNEFLHNKKCDNMYSLISKNHLLLIELAPQEEGNIKINKFQSNCQLINIEKEESNNFTVEMTNYCIPFDFHEPYFIWVEFLNQKDRNLCVKNVIDLKDPVIKKKLEHNFGHISHCKILSEKNIVLVRNLNKCEIREINNEFTLVNSFTSFGDEVIAIDVFNDYYNNNDINESEDDIKFKEKNKFKNDDDILKIRGIPITTNNLDKESYESDSIKDQNSISKESESSNENFTKRNFKVIISFLDIDGNVNVYENNKISKKFNLYDIKGINKEQKKKMFFSMGYAYYIKSNKQYTCISTDHGCYIIQRNIK